ncbi:hypothetical protein E143388_07578 [Rhodococcus opacus]|nr:hypothetical protein E143388_07578 [Rhodococcus opacus]
MLALFGCVVPVGVRSRLDVMKRGGGLPLLMVPSGRGGVRTRIKRKGDPLMYEYEPGTQFVGVDLHRRRSVIVRHNGEGEQLSIARIVNDPDTLKRQLDDAGPHPEVVLEATYGWY